MHQAAVHQLELLHGCRCRAARAGLRRARHRLRESGNSRLPTFAASGLAAACVRQHGTRPGAMP